MKCPKCKSDNVQRYEVAYMQGTSDINTTSQTLGVGFGGRKLGFGAANTQTKGTSQTLLSGKTKPPKANHSGSYTIAAAVCLIPLFVADGYGWYTFFVLLAIGGYFASKLFQAEEKKIQEQLDEWKKSWYCNKCGNSFVK
jgi:hypothetical protein